MHREICSSKVIFQFICWVAETLPQQMPRAILFLKAEHRDRRPLIQNNAFRRGNHGNRI